MYTGYVEQILTMVTAIVYIHIQARPWGGGKYNFCPPPRKNIKTCKTYCKKCFLSCDLDPEIG